MLNRIALAITACIVGYSVANAVPLAAIIGLIICVWLILSPDGLEA